MSTPRTSVWTAVPHGRRGSGRMDLSVRITANYAVAEDDLFSGEWKNWPETVLRTDAFEVCFRRDGGSNGISVAVDGRGVFQEDLVSRGAARWRAIFGVPQRSGR